MGDLLVRNVADPTKAALKRKAKAAGKSVNELAREVLTAAAKPSKEEAGRKSTASAKRSARFRATPLPTSAATTDDARRRRQHRGAMGARPGGLCPRYGASQKEAA